jgi:hypothetical protein
MGCDCMKASKDNTGTYKAYAKKATAKAVGKSQKGKRYGK